MARPSTTAVLKSNAQILETMGAQFEELARRTLEGDERLRLLTLARKCRFLADEMSDAVYPLAA